MPKRIHDETIAHHPHDGLVKRTFTVRETAAVELQHVLPATLCDRLDWATLEIEPTSFVDRQLHPRTTDILYAIRPKGSDVPVSIYVVLEHQSTPEPAMAARFLVYVGRFYERVLRENPGSKTVPLVIPVLLYQAPPGGPSRWTLPTTLSELLDVPSELTEAFPPPVELAFAVDDLSESLLGEQVSHDQLARDRWRARAEMARSLLWLARNPDATTGERGAALGQLLTIIDQTWGPDAVEPFLTYLVAAFEPQSPLHAILTAAASQETLLMYATLQDELIAKGKASGVAEGIAEGEAKMLIRLLDSRDLSPSEDQRRRVRECKDEALLQRWFDRALTATNVAEVFED